ncbi:MAG: phosphoglycolate phosphatase [Pseudorhodoplanes sp.]|jgi:phosphoglycolate phosphatase|nr:phosphoglycolate phosphatase [Pseudorhodoplanes sp.]
MSRPIVVFDLDGTLVDTAPDLVDTLNVILTREGIPPMAYDAARMLIGGGVRPMLERALAEQNRALPVAELDDLFQTFLKHYADHIADRSRPFPGVEQALDILAERGCMLAVCTNKFEWLSRRLLDALQLTQRFAAICGQDTFEVKKPHPDVLRKTVARAGGEMMQTVMVGDSATDIRLAQAAEVPVVAVDFGYTDTPVAAFQPDRVISGYAALPATIFELVPMAGRGRATVNHN